MRDVFYADNRDLVKWGILLRLAEIYQANRIVQLAYYRPSEFGRLMIDSQEHDVPAEVVAHFRNLRVISALSSKIRVSVFDPVFDDRVAYERAALAFLSAFAEERCIVFLDPDTGLESQKPSQVHVLATEARAIWDAMKRADLFALYQHKTNKSDEPWIEPKRSQLATALGIPLESILTGSGTAIARDVVLFYTQRS